MSVYKITMNCITRKDVEVIADSAEEARLIVDDVYLDTFDDVSILAVAHKN